MIFRLSQKLARKIKVGKLSELSLDENPCADWSCHLFLADRTQYVIVSNTAALYSCVFYGKGITSGSLFLKRALATIRESLESSGHASTYQEHIAPASASVTFAKALNRSVTGSMNDLINHAKVWLETGEVSPFEAGSRLNDVLLSALGDDSSSYGNPIKAFNLLAMRAERGEW